MVLSLGKLGKGLKRENSKLVKNFIRDSKILVEMIHRNDGDADEVFKILNGNGIFPYNSSI